MASISYFEVKELCCVVQLQLVARHTSNPPLRPGSALLVVSVCIWLALHFLLTCCGCQSKIVLTARSRNIYLPGPVDTTAISVLHFGL